LLALAAISGGRLQAQKKTKTTAQAKIQAIDAQGAPMFKVDAFWPKPLPNNWVMGTVTGMSVDQEDHIWVLDRPGNTPAGKTAAPAVLEFDIEGNLLRSWGTPASAPEGVWPKQVHTIFTDREHNVWLAGAGPGDTLVQFTADGKFLRDFGNREAWDSFAERFRQPVVSFARNRGRESQKQSRPPPRSARPDSKGYFEVRRNGEAG
jgi:hypothetical protein